MKTTFLLCSALLLGACSQSTPVVPAVKPENAKPVAQKAFSTTTKLGSAARYRCKDEKIVKVVRNLKVPKKAKKVDAINLSFNNMTEKLIYTVSESGRSYTNIHWHWIEKSESSALTNSLGEILAEDCVLEVNK